MRKLILSAAIAAASLALTQPASAVLTLNNGSFESIGAQFNGALGGLHEATGWTHLSGLNFQASSMLSGQEGTPPTATGSRILRLVSDNPNPQNTGSIAQFLGNMVPGETYRFTADAFGGPGAGLAWGATAKFVNQASNTPSTTYATYLADGVNNGVFAPGAVNLMYTATAADAGQPLFVLLTAVPSGPGQATRGGIDNAQIFTGAAPMTLVNGSFELPTPVAPGNNFDTITPTGWSFQPIPGLAAYPRVGSGGFGYPAAAEGTTIYAPEGERGGILFQDMGVMVAGETYDIEGVVSTSSGLNSYRVSLIGDAQGASPAELAFITEADFNPSAGSSLDFLFSYTATAADAGKVLRLAISDNGTSAGSRSAFDNLQLTVSAVPEPASATMGLLMVLTGAMWRRRRIA